MSRNACMCFWQWWCLETDIWYLEENMLQELRQARKDRLQSEKKREELVKKARAMQAKTNNRRNQGNQTSGIVCELLIRFISGIYCQ